jgi:hypothetical protein
MGERGLWKEGRVVMQPGTDKIFSAEWLSDRLVVMGTKCNKVSATHLLMDMEMIDFPCTFHVSWELHFENHLPCQLRTLFLPPNHLLLDSAPNPGPLISRWEINKFESC